MAADVQIFTSGSGDWTKPSGGDADFDIVHLHFIRDLTIRGEARRVTMSLQCPIEIYRGLTPAKIKNAKQRKIDEYIAAQMVTDGAR